MSVIYILIDILLEIVPKAKLTHWGRVTHICIGKLTIIGSVNGLSPGRRQAIIWTNAEILLIWPLGTNFSEILIEIRIFSFKKMCLNVSSAKWRPFCLDLNVLINDNYVCGLMEWCRRCIIPYVVFSLTHVLPGVYKLGHRRICITRPQCVNHSNQ